MDEVTTFSYDIGMSAPGPYSMAVTDAYFTYIGDYTGEFNFPFGFVRGGFTNSPGNFSRGPKPMPDSLYIEWLSIIERKIYRANIDLHKNGLRDSMLKLFRQGYWDDAPSISEYEDREAIKRAGGKRVTYNAISITILPGGKLWMYIREQYGSRIVFVGEIGQGYEVPFDSAIHRRIDRNLGHTVKGEKDFFDIMQPDINYGGSDSLYAKFLAKHGKTYAYSLFPRYQERFRYNIAFEFEKPNTRLKEQTRIWFINQECYWSEQRTPLDTKTRLTTIYTGWIVEDSIWYTARFYFNEQELLDNFDKMYKKDKDAQGTLLIKVNKYSNSFFDIYLKVGDDSIKFEKTHIHIFKGSSDLEKRKKEKSTLHFWNFRNEHLPAYVGENIIDWDK